MRDVALHGATGSGKSTVAQLLANIGYQHVKSGLICRRICADLFDTEATSLLHQVTDALRAIDPAVWLKAALRGVEAGRPVVFDSMRFAVDYDYFRSAQFLLVRVEAPAADRFLRLARRGQEYNPAVDGPHAVETELSERTYDFTIRNVGDRAALTGQVADLRSMLLG